jgi:hypothetical protein
MQGRLFILPKVREPAKTVSTHGWAQQAAYQPDRNASTAWAIKIATLRIIKMPAISVHMSNELSHWRLGLTPVYPSHRPDNLAPPAAKLLAASENLSQHIFGAHLNHAALRFGDANEQ